MGDWLSKNGASIFGPCCTIKPILLVKRSLFAMGFDKEKYEMAQTEKADLLKQLEEVKEEAYAAKFELAELKIQLQEKTDKAVELQNLLDIREADRNATIANGHAEHVRVRAHRDDLIRENRNLKERVKTMEDRLRVSREGDLEVDAALKDARKKVEVLKGELTIAKKEATDLEGRLKDTCQVNENLLEELKKTELAFQSWKEKANMWAAKYDDASGELEKAREELAKRQQETRGFVFINEDEFDRVLAAAEETTKKLQTAERECYLNRDLAKKLDEAKTERDRALAEVEKWRQTSRVQDLKKLRVELATYEQALKSMNVLCREKEATEEQLRSDMDEMKKLYDEAQEISKQRLDGIARLCQLFLLWLVRFDMSTQMQVEMLEVITTLPEPPQPEA